ncbi:ABC transporter ATP-binding protein [Achromobacter sp. K91]|jgi:branched-chain amino acid transport system ATP-binding protein|uniref:ABC transporter ATP-binding protein n=1 Tax=Achromobacter TaxID=222 RepID=UPI000D494BC6|nr:MULTISPECIES: ABC transporter ATP-binding protein [Achromobacter]MBD9473074.1 ABC transporter ATP-binding protein [Achromobacter sp. ACM01]MDQ1763489.1 ABC transporter ATP-binding protein [Achromobacter aegrifaciens]PTN50430.1 ABC transporter ATP-binding protein [Achromobacter xylosoxidans]RIJ05492.1 ABC transporter ATP-binding protein [Achromobacter sp. K91]
MSDIALQCAQVSVTFGALRAIEDFSYTFETGRVYGLIGPNGAGKTTLLNVLSGNLPGHGGRILCHGADISRLRAHERARHGIGRSFQITKIFPEMTVLENLRIAAQISHSHLLPFWLAPRYDRRLASTIDAMLELTDLTAWRDTVAGTLSYGLQRALELGLTLLPDPRILLLDEPLAGVGHHEIAAATRLIRHAAAGRTVLLIEHNMDVIMTLSEHIVVLSNGRKVAEGPPAAIRDDATVRAVYLGEEVAA